MIELILVLDNVRSVHNVGSLFRTADGAGVSRIILVGYTPSPFDRYGNERKDFCKVSLGAEKSIPWESVEDVNTVISSLKSDGYEIAMLEQNVDSVSLFDWKSKADSKVALIVGNEVDGISQQTLSLADVILEIPMRGEKESLNVSVVGGIAMFELLR